MALAMEMASMKPMSEMVTAAVMSCCITSQSNTGRLNPGRPSGIVPTTAPPAALKFVDQASRVVITTAASTLGTLGR